MRQYIKTILITFLIVALLFVILYSIGSDLMSTFSPQLQISNEIKSNDHVSVGGDAPYFDLPSVRSGRLNSIDTKDKSLVLTFLATWSMDSVNQIKIFDDYISTLDKSDIDSSSRIVIIDSQESRNKIMNVLRRGGYKTEVLFDEDGSVSNVYGVKTLPTTFFIDKNGKILEIYTGTLNQKDLVSKITDIIR